MMGRDIEKRRAYKKRNKDKIRAYAVEYCKKNKSKIRESVLRYLARNAEVMHQKRLVRYIEKRAELLAAAKDYARKNPAKRAAIEMARIAKKRAATPSWADLASIQRRYDWARLLTEEFGQPFHVDHIVPLKSDIVCGLHCEANLAVIPGRDNQSKGNRRWPGMPT